MFLDEESVGQVGMEERKESLKLDPTVFLYNPTLARFPIAEWRTPAHAAYCLSQLTGADFSPVEDKTSVIHLTMN